MESAAVPVGSQATARTFDDDNSDDGVVAAIIEVYLYTICQKVEVAEVAIYYMEYIQGRREYRELDPGGSKYFGYSPGTS